MSLNRNPWQNALSFTFFGLLFIALALSRCKLRKSPWSIIGCTWSDSVWWSEAGFGAALLLVSVYFWKKAMKPLS
jgi:hypothetical protein